MFQANVIENKNCPKLNQKFEISLLLSKQNRKKISIFIKILRIRKDPSFLTDPDPFGQKSTDPDPRNTDNHA